MTTNQGDRGQTRQAPAVHEAPLLDLRGTACPMNWVKLKLRLEELEAGQVLAVLLDDGDAIRNVPRSAKAEGNLIREAIPLEGGFRLLIEKAGAPGAGEK